MARHVVDSPEQIKKCLNCTLPRCVNCVVNRSINPCLPKRVLVRNGAQSFKEAYVYIPPISTEEETLIKLYRDGKRDTEIGEVVGHTAVWVMNHRKRLGLPALPRRAEHEYMVWMVEKWMAGEYHG